MFRQDIDLRSKWTLDPAVDDCSICKTAYSGANRTRNPIDVGQCSDSSRTAFRFLSDSVPIQFGQCSGLRPDSFWATLEWCPKRSERCPREPGRVSERGRNRGAGVVERRWV